MTKTVNLRALPDDLVREAKAVAAYRGQTLKAFFIDCITSKLAIEKRKIRIEQATKKRK